LVPGAVSSIGRAVVASIALTGPSCCHLWLPRDSIPQWSAVTLLCNVVFPLGKNPSHQLCPRVSREVWSVVILFPICLIFSPIFFISGCHHTVPGQSRFFILTFSCWCQTKQPWALLSQRNLHKTEEEDSTRRDRP
jgi:hypothetical protein